MNNRKILSIFFISLFALQAFKATIEDEPWDQKQLIQPDELAKMINGKKDVFIFGIGPGGGIKNSVVIGETKSKENLDKLRIALDPLSRDANVVIYCGCCPFRNCPNIRPAFSLLNEMKFANQKLLDLKQNLKVDWIDKKYPVNEEQ